MAKQALLDVLEQTIGKYVKNLDAESLNVAVWSGKIELHALELDVDSVNAELSRQAAEAPNLAIPLRVTSGQISSFEVDVPWARLMSRPVILRARGLTVEVEPFDRTANADFLHAVAESEAIRARKIREARVESISSADEYRKRSNTLRKLAEQDLEAVADPTKSKQVATSNTNASFGARLVRRIIENIQVEIGDVHVSLKGAECKAGVVLESLQLVTTDKNGQRTFVDRTSGSQGLENSFLYKALKIKGLGVYLDEDETKHSRLNAIQEESGSGPRHSYVLAPLSFEAKLRQADSNICVEFPKYLLASELSSLSILISKTQLDLGNKISQAVKRSSEVARPLFPEYRPLTRVTKKTAKDWWKYAVRCVGRLNGRRSWVEFYLAFQEGRKYIPLYKRHAHHTACSWLKALTPDEQVELENIEGNRTISVEGFMTWRNIADAQMEKEKEKYDEKRASEKGSLFTSLFGTTKKIDANAPNEEDAPIALSVEEMRELAALSLEQVTDNDLSQDSKLCEVKFILGSFRVHLTSYDLRPIADLQMGTVSTAFDASADGSFAFDFTLASLEITDMVTPKSFFPSVLKNQNVSQSPGVSEAAFSVHVEKTKSGDQYLDVKLSTFEAVASPVLFVELKRLFSLSSLPTSRTSSHQNPMLAQSLSGSVDLFYDATLGASSHAFVEPLGVPETPLVDVGGISEALIDAWKSKTETHAAWIIELDIHAPILVVPENCTDSRANILMFDLGHLKLQYGKIGTVPKVKEWFRNNPRHQSDEVDPVLDNASLKISDLTFMIGRANYWHRMARKNKVSDPNEEEDDDAIVEPISLSVDLGIESRAKEGVPRVCTFGVLPSISLSLSPSQLSRMLAISKAWMKVSKEIFSSSPDIVPVEQVDDDMSTSSAPDKLLQFVEQARRYSIFDSGLQQQQPFVQVHADMRLQQLSLKILTDAGNGMEAHLVSVFASLSTLSDGSTKGKLSMGWFWILDRFENEFPRRQRLVAHSSLPVSPEALAEDEKYEILGELERIGAFNEDFGGSTDLADISFKQSGDKTFGTLDPFTSDSLAGDGYSVDSILDVKFTSLYVNWNPQAVKTITEMTGRFAQYLDSTFHSEAGSLVVSSPTQLQPRRRSSTGSKESYEAKQELQAAGTRSIMLIRATMDSFEVSLNSARDDFPLFLLKMSRTMVSLVSSSDKTMKMSLSLGDLSVSTPDMGRTDPLYRTILGLAPGRSESLLSVTYCEGMKAMETMNPDDIDLNEYEACAQVELSPMRMVYIQAQALALVEYATAGILGALASQAASSAAVAATEIATSIGAKKFFSVKATGFEVILPQAAYLSTWISVRTGLMRVDYVALPEPGGGQASLTLSDVVLMDDRESQMQEEPIGMSIDVGLPPDAVGTNQDQAMRVDVSISKASFIFSKGQYAQLLSTLDLNMGETDLCLRESSTESLLEENPSDSDSTGFLSGLTHAGVVTVDNPRRINADIQIIAFSLELCGASDADPIVRLAAVEAGISLKMLPDVEKMTCEVSLRDLICDDRRLKAIGRQYRSLIYQNDQEVVNGTPEAVQNLFLVSYEANHNGSSTVDLTIGSPRLVFIPDVISEVLAFIDVPRQQKKPEVVTISSEHEAHPEDSVEREVVKVEASGSQDVIEAGFVLQSDALQFVTMALAVKTAQCSIILVDLGSDSLLPPKGSSLSASSVSSVAETIVLAGTFSANVSLDSSAETGELMNVQAEIHGDKLEAYTAFGRDLNSPLQILDPMNFSVYFTSKTVDDTGATARSVDLRAAALTPLDISLSMRNVALVSAILSSIAECFDDGSKNQDSDERFLSQQETARIEKLASALLREDTDLSSHSQDSSSMADPSTLSVTGHGDTVVDASVVSVKLTMPETKVTLINDLQGIDEALLRITIRNLVVGGEVRAGERAGSSQFTGFDCNVHTSILADYYDSSSNDWEVLLLKPWEATLKAGRRPSKNMQSSRPSTAIDLESFPCYMSFSEQFLMSLASANRMWSVYSAATSSALNSVGPSLLSDNSRKSMAATAARTFITSLPYALDNHSGVPVEFRVHGKHEDLRTCESGSIEYFRFEPPPGDGSGGKRLYGHDVAFAKSICVLVGDSSIELINLDGSLGTLARAHELKNGQVLMTRIVKEGKTIVLHISSGVNLRNRTSIPFSISVVETNGESNIGISQSSISQSNAFSSSKRSSVVVRDGFMSKPSHSLGVPVGFVDTFRASWATHDEAALSLVVSPRITGIPNDFVLNGLLSLKPDRDLLSRAKGGTIVERFDVTCRPVSLVEGTDTGFRHGIDSFVLRVCIATVLVDEKHPLIEISLEPRAIMENKMPVALSIRSPMPHIFSFMAGEPRGRTDIDHSVQEGSSVEAFEGEIVHELQPDTFMEVFTPGPSIAVKIKCTDNPVGGSTTDWMEGGWVDLPMISEFSVPDPFRCVFPFVRKVNDPLSLAGSRGSEFFIAEGNNGLSELSVDSAAPKEGGTTSAESSGVEVIAPSESQDDRRAFYVTVRNYAIDHTGDILFEQLQGSGGAQLRRSSTDIDKGRRSSSAQVSAPFGAFRSQKHRGRISLLPGSHVPIRLLHLTMDGDEGLKKSTPFRIEEVSICEGGVDATPLHWEDGTASGYFAYRKLVNSYQSEVHVIPEYIVFNGSELHQVRVRQPGGAEMIIQPRQVAPLRTQFGETAIITVEYMNVAARTAPIRVDSLGIRVAVVKSPDGIPIGSLAVQTVVGAQDSRLVIKLGEIKHGSLAAPEELPGAASGLFDNDFMRCRIHWSELRITLKEPRPTAETSKDYFKLAVDRIRKVVPSPTSNRNPNKKDTPVARTQADEQKQGVKEGLGKPDQDGMMAVCTILFQRFTVDWQRVFKVEVASQRKSVKEALSSPERSQLSVIIHNVQLRDDTPESPFPIVFDSTSEISFFDLCIRCRGSLNAEMVKVDLFDLNLAHSNGISDHINLSTSEDFIWKLLDLGDRIIAAAGEFAGVNIELKWDEEHDGYTVSIRDRSTSYLGEETKYTPPQSDRLYAITKARVSPFNIIASFTRNPQTSRYKMVKGIAGANLMNYFTRRLKFKIDKAQLKFSRYEANNIKGPPDRLAELISTVYVSRMKLKLVTIMTAASFQDWKFLSARDGGDDEFVEGDILRVTGNLAGNSANYVLKKAGAGLGHGVSRATNAFGESIESASGALGARHVGAGINSFVSGVGDGVGDTLTGVGTGAGKIFKGAGQGVGQLFGGVSGGAMLIGKGVGRGITTGDGRAVVSGITEGVTSVGTGVGQGVESVVTGAAGGVYSVGKGLFSGVKSVGKGIGGAFAGKKAAKKWGKHG